MSGGKVDHILNALFSKCGHNSKLKNMATTRLCTFTFFTTCLRKNAQLDYAYIFWLPVMKIPSVKTSLLIIVHYYTPFDYDSWLFYYFV
jgi:hypothetical protein